MKSSTDKSSLVSVLHELGSACCEPPILEDILSQIIPTCKNPEAQLAQSSLMIAESAINDKAWNAEVFTEIVLRTFPKIKRHEIVRELDGPNFYISDTRVAEVLLKTWKILFPKFYEEFPVKVLFMKWSNVKGQLSLLLNLLLLGPEVINFGRFPAAARVISNEDLNLSTAANKLMLVNLSNQTWNCYEIYDLSCKLVDTEFFEDVRPIFELASRQCSELLCIGLAMFNPSWNSILKEILVKLTCGFLLGQPSSSIVLPRIWNLNPNIMMLCMVEMHRRDASCLSRLLDVAQDLKILTVVLETKPYSFALDMAALASRRQHLNLEKWLADSIKEKGPAFFKASIEFALEKLRRGSSSAANNNNNSTVVPLAPEVMNVFAKVFQSAASTPSASPECTEALRLFYAEMTNSGNGPAALEPVLGGDPAVSTTPSSPTGAATATGTSTTFPQDIEDEVNAFFEKIFSKEFPVGEVIELLKRLRASTQARDQQLFSCMIQNLFDEYRFFAKYPDNELALTATIFGAIIRHNLISHVPLGVGLRYVLEALKKPPTHKLYKFGLQALLQFQRRLLEWPQYCTHLLAIPHLCQAHPELAGFLQTIAGGNASPSLALPFPEAEVASGSGGVSASGTSTASSSDVLDAHRTIPAPPDTVRDKILFVLNNLSTGNIDQKVVDLRKLLLGSPYYAWFAQYLVVKRAGMETNYHSLYAQLLECFGDDGKLLSAVLRETFVVIDALLKSPKTAAQSTERLYLKNLGIWLGTLTLARDRPILHGQLNLKGVLLDAVLTNRLIVVIPFACKVLEQGAYSRVFRPFNPYLMGCIKLLVELYKYADLKLNLKFEIEVLCKALGLDVKDIKPSSFLKDRSRLRAIPAAASLNLGAVSTSASSASASSTAAGNNFNTSQLSALPEAMTVPLLNSLVTVMGVNKLPLPEFGYLLKLFPLAVEYAIRELSFSVSERSINIATVTAKSLISKDFNSSTQVTKSAALRLLQYLSGSLASASLKESIRPAVLSNLKTFLQISELANPLGDAIWMGLVEENIEHITGFIEQGTADKVAVDFDQLYGNGLEWINPALKGAPRPEVYEAIFKQQRFNSPSPAALPLTAIKSIVPGEYDQLVSSLRALNLTGAGAGVVVSSPAVTATAASVTSPASAAVATTVADVMDVFIKLLASIEKACGAVGAGIGSVAKLAPESEVRRLMKQAVPLASSLPSQRDELCLLMCQRLMQLLYKCQVPLFADVIILLLVKIFEFSAKVAKEVTTWIIYSEDDRKYNVLATWALFNSGLVYVLDYDAQLARQLEKTPTSEAALAFALQLIRKCVFEEPSVAAPYDFVYSLEALKQLYTKRNSRDEAIKSLLDDLTAKTRRSGDVKASRESVAFCFTDWFRLCQYPSISDKLVHSFMTQLFEYGFFRSEVTSKLFFQVCTETAIEIYVRQRRSPAILSYRSVEAYARLLFNILKWTGGPAGEAAIGTKDLLIIALKIVGVILGQGLEQGMDYLQKPFSRFLNCFLLELYKSEAPIVGVNEIVGEFLLTINPLKMPKFCFAWFEAISSTGFLGLFLTTSASQSTSSDVLLEALKSLFTFMKPVSEAYSFAEPSYVLYKGALKLMAVILHDCPAFLVQNHVQLCLVIPKEFVQLRNIILAAVPDSLATDSLPDPLAPGLKIDTLPGIKSRPELPAEFISSCLDPSLSLLIDECLGSVIAASPASIAQILGKMADESDGIALVNFIALRVNSAFSEASFKTASALLCSLLAAANASSSVRFGLLTGMANHLRYPNYLTYFFSCVLLQAFRLPGPTEQQIKGQLVRVLLERLVVYRPHPWGLMITFMELIRNPEYRFWSQPLVKASPELERMFETVAKSCLVN